MTSTEIKAELAKATGEFVEFLLKDGTRIRALREKGIAFNPHTDELVVYAYRGRTLQLDGADITMVIANPAPAFSALVHRSVEDMPLSKEPRSPVSLELEALGQEVQKRLLAIENAQHRINYVWYVIMALLVVAVLRLWFKI